MCLFSVCTWKANIMILGVAQTVLLLYDTSVQAGKPRSPDQGGPQIEKGSDSVLRVVAWGHHGFSAVLSELMLLLGSPAGCQNIEAKDESQRTGQQAGNGQVIIGWRVQRVIG